MIDNLPPTLTRVDPATKRSAEYIRADVAAAQLAERDKRIAELEASCIGYKHVAETEADYSAKLKNRIAELESLCRTMQNLSDVHGLLHGNALARIAELESAQQWISVDERLPDYDIDVLVYANTPLDRNAWDIARLYKLYGWMVFTEWEFGAPTPTHWMPLPPPPVTNETEATSE